MLPKSKITIFPDGSSRIDGIPDSPSGNEYINSKETDTKESGKKVFENNQQRILKKTQKVINKGKWN